jgi:hypothetical protein
VDEVNQCTEGKCNYMSHNQRINERLSGPSGVAESEQVQ